MIVEVQPMIVPSAIPFASIPNGGVWSQDLKDFWIKNVDGSSSHLTDGNLLGAGSAPSSAFYFPAAKLVLG